MSSTSLLAPEYSIVFIFFNTLIKLLYSGCSGFHTCRCANCSSVNVPQFVSNVKLILLKLYLSANLTILCNSL